MLAIPLIWSFVGFTAALLLNVKEDTGIVGKALIISRGRRRHLIGIL